MENQSNQSTKSSYLPLKETESIVDCGGSLDILFISIFKFL